jgi:hypothetical protein
MADCLLYMKEEVKKRMFWQTLSTGQDENMSVKWQSPAPKVVENLKKMSSVFFLLYMKEEVKCIIAKSVDDKFVGPSGCRTIGASETDHRGVGPSGCAPISIY